MSLGWKNIICHLRLKLFCPYTFMDESEASKKLKKSRPKKQRLSREDFGDPSEIGAFKGPWSGFLGISERREDPMKVKEELSLRRVVNKHCLVVGKERLRSSGIISMDSYSDSGRNMSKRFITPKSDTMLFHDHKDMITSVQLFKGFQLALSSSLDGKVCLYSLRNDKGLVTTYMGHSKAVSSALLDKDECRINTVSFDEFMKGWDIETGRCDLRINALCPLTCQAPQTLDKVVFAGGVDGKVKVLDLRSKKISKEMKRSGDEGSEGAESISFRPYSMLSIHAVESDNILASSTRDGSLHLWDLRNDEILKSYKNFYSFISFDQKNRRFIVVSNEHAELIDMISLERMPEKVGIPGCCTQIKISENGNILCYGSRDGTIGIVNCEEANVISSGSANERISSIDWIEGSSSSFISGDVLGNIKVWE